MGFGKSLDEALYSLISSYFSSLWDWTLFTHPWLFVGLSW